MKLCVGIALLFAKMTAAAQNPIIAPGSCPSIKLNNGLKMPQLGLGTWKSKPGEVKTAVRAAILAGYTHIDCAFIYGNEGEVGEAIADAIAAGEIRREDLWVTSKLWNDKHADADVEPALRATLKELRLDYIDLYLIHWPVTGVAGASLTPTYAETWGAMERLTDLGLARSIGVSNLAAGKLRKLCSDARTRIVPAVNQVPHPPSLISILLPHAPAASILLHPPVSPRPSSIGAPPPELRIARRPTQKNAGRGLPPLVTASPRRVLPCELVSRWSCTRCCGRTRSSRCARGVREVCARCA